jgi:hypothetical protein
MTLSLYVTWTKSEKNVLITDQEKKERSFRLKKLFLENYEINSRGESI